MWRRAAAVAILLPAALGLEDPLGSNCLIHYDGFTAAGLADVAEKLCVVATFAAAHNCSALLPAPAALLHPRHNNGEAVGPDVPWSRYFNLQSNPEMSGSRTILEVPRNASLCSCLDCRNGSSHLACPDFLGEGWLRRRYEGTRGLKELVRQLHIDVRRGATSRRVYAFSGDNLRFRYLKKSLGGMSVEGFLTSAVAHAAASGLSARADLVKGRQWKGLQQLGMQASGRWSKKRPQGSAEPRLMPCGMGPSEALERHVQAIKAGALGGEAFAHLRLRRGDKAKVYPTCSRARNVARAFLEKMAAAMARRQDKSWPRVLLVHSDEEDPEYWRALGEAFRGSFAKVVTERELPRPFGDNYFAYAASQLLPAHAVFDMRFHPRTVRHCELCCPQGL